MMKAFTKERQRVRQLVHWKPPRDFLFGPFSFITLLLVCGVGLAIEFARQGLPVVVVNPCAPVVPGPAVRIVPDFILPFPAC